MAILDTENNQIVIRLIYDGAPLSGKTTSLKLLAGSLAQNVYTPEEVNGRTTYFDWVEYIGGLFEGYQIRCQIISVPGQPVLAPRRQRLIESADVIVFVGDTTHNRLHESVAYLKGLARHLRSLKGPPVGIIFQANKRDCADAVAIEDIQQRFDEELRDVAVVESVATEGFGIRHTFVFAVRLCLDRVRELIKSNTLPQGKPEDETGEDLLRSIKATEINRLSPEIDKTLIDMSAPSAQDLPANEALRDVLIIESAGHASSSIEENNFDELTETRAREMPRVPTPDVAGGMIWPPVEGRIILNEIARFNPSPILMDTGDWGSTLLQQWHIYSYRNAVFHGLAESRQMLIQWVHLHLGVSSFLSPRRCLVLNEDGNEKWRLWQIVRVEKTLRDHINVALAEEYPERVAEGIWDTAYILVAAAEKFGEASSLIECSIGNISYRNSLIFYSGLMPDLSSSLSSAGVCRELDISEIIRSQLSQIIIEGLARRHDDIGVIIDCLCRRADSSSRSQNILESICDILETSPVSI